MDFEPLKNYEDFYLINRNGDIKTIKRQGTDERILKPCVGKNGYKMVSLTTSNKGKSFTLHKLLAIQFLENPNKYPIIDHIDRNKLNNSLENLRWTTYSENNSNVIKNGSIYIDKCIKNNVEYFYFRVVYRQEPKKRFKVAKSSFNST